MTLLLQSGHNRQRLGLVGATYVDTPLAQGSFEVGERVIGAVIC